MKSKALIITTIVFFAIVNTMYYWEGQLGLFAFPAFILLGIVYLCLVVAFLRQIFFAVKEKFTDRSRLLTIGMLIIVLPVVLFWPAGLIDFDKWEGNNLLVAHREGGGNCMTTLKLKTNNKFVEKSVCFGESEVKGTYEVHSDTIYFNKSGNHQNDEYYLYAVINQPDQKIKGSKGTVSLYKTITDNKPLSLWITKNECK